MRRLQATPTSGAASATPSTSASGSDDTDRRPGQLVSVFLYQTSHSMSHVSLLLSKLARDPASTTGELSKRDTSGVPECLDFLPTFHFAGTSG